MNYAKISTLLDQFWEGETSLDEEVFLKKYFQETSENEVDERLRKFRPYFLALKIESEIGYKTTGKTVNLHARTRPDGAAGWRFSIFRYAAAAAVVGLLAVGTWWWTHREDQKQVATVNQKMYEDTFDNPEDAAAEIKAALALVSKKMRKGKTEATKGLKKLGDVEKFIPKQN